MDQIELRKLLDELRFLPKETEWVEFKGSNQAPQQIGEQISALSNAACLWDKPNGYLVFGIRDNDHKIIGTQFRPKRKKIGNEELENWLATQLSPRIDFQIYELTYEESPIVIFIIDATVSRPVAFKDEEYIRVGSYTKKLSDHPEKARKIWLKTSKRAFEKEIALNHVDENEVLRLLDYPTYFKLLNVNLPTNKGAIAATLEREKLIEKANAKYNITNLGAILFANDLSAFEGLSRKGVRVIIYKGKNRLETIKEQDGVKGYAVGFEGLIDYINDKLPTNEEIGKAFRKEVKMYPEIAIRELVANALIHQDFEITGTGPMVEIFQDRIEITNPGKPLIPTLRFIDHNPQSRNEKLAFFMRRINICEERGSGIDKVVAATEVYQLPAPDFVDSETFLKVTLYGYKSLRQMGKEDKIRVCYQHCCLKWVSAEYMTNKTLRERFKINQKNYSVVSRIISDTIEAGLIKAYDPESRSKKFAKYVPFWA